jgi:3-phenylpropionate/trans-cinnamate dioxygenase ferredoxin reductase component
VVVGAGQAGGRAVEALRQGGFVGRITLIGNEPALPYERPPLSKGLLVGNESPESVYLHKKAFFENAGIELLLDTRVDTVSPATRSVFLADGRSIQYSRLLLCTGSRVRPLSGIHHLPRGVHYLRTLQDSCNLARDLVPGRKLVAIGGGFIGLEVASSAVTRGLTVTVVERANSLLDRVLPEAIASKIESLYRGNNVDVRLSSTVVGLHGMEHIEAVELANGSVIPADVVVIGIGAIPNTDLASSAGAATMDGILVNEYGESTVPYIYAAGDVTNHPNPILKRRLRLESWQNAQNQAMSVAQTILGKKTSYSEVPWFWSDQLGHSIQLMGVFQPGAQIVWRSDPCLEAWMAFALEAGRIVAAATFDQGREMRFARKLIEDYTEIAPDVLGDCSISLKDMVAAHRSVTPPATH